jgi:heme exporter protein A
MTTLLVQSLACKRNGRTIFRDVGFSLKPGDMLMITGANGSGKTSLLRQLAGLLPMVTGDIRWDNKPVTDDMTAYLQQLQFVGHLEAIKPELTVRETLSYWSILRGQGKASSADCLAVFNLESFIDLPVCRLSAGQKRRLSLTRLLLNPAPLWLLDEPGTALDHAATDKLVEAVTNHCGNGGMAIVVTHHDIGLKPTQSFHLMRKEAA